MNDDHRIHIQSPVGEVRINMNELDATRWIEFSDFGLRQYLYWVHPSTGDSIALLDFKKGGGIPMRHSHASNQFMYCIEGEYEYTTDNLVLIPGSFYMNPKDNPHGPTIARKHCLLIEIYDSCHYYEKPVYHPDNTMMITASDAP